MEKVETDSDPLWEWPKVAYLIVVAFAAPLIALELLDVAMAISVHFGIPAWQGLALTAEDAALVPAYGVCCYLLSRRGVQGAYLAALGVFVSVLVCFNFRGTYIRVGTFDMWAVPAWRWLRLVALGLVGGVASGLLAERRRGVAELWRPRFTWIWPVSLIAVSWLSSATARFFGASSMWAPTRAIALSAVGLALLGFFVAAEPSRRGYEPESVHAR